ncbi:MAG TPA: DUF47 family protein [Bacteroidia bacterium]|nr:DUF47 family protein [Sphingobacteriales bacterium]HPD64681.1 DUF47 family protein [Bacteroidia bacterium]HRS59455.1 DUF47 family protein [Bacteroidia bacterium]HRU67786.1 DUF47 family protein [Bacteroidia bacterium]
MKLDKIFQALVPKEKKFFPLLETAADNLVSCSELFIKLIKIENIEERLPVIIQIKESEKTGDEIIKTVISELNSTFIVPFERDDIFNLITALDDVIDGIDGTSQRISYLRPKIFPPEIIEIADRLLLACQEIKVAVHGLQNMKNIERLKENCQRVKIIEKETDELFHLSISRLMKNEEDPVEFIKKKEILEVLEECIDLTEDVTDIIRGIIVRFG